MHPSNLHNPTSTQLEQAIARNHTEMFCLNALALGGEVRTHEGITWTHPGAGIDGIVPFPLLDERNAGAQLDTILAYYRNVPTKGAGCWSLATPQVPELNSKLLARGFQPGWKPYWMVLDLETINTSHPAPADLQIRADNEARIDEMQDLPYSGNDGAISLSLMQVYPERAVRLLGWIDGEIVAQTCAFLTTGEDGIAGIYNVGVLPRVRRKGIGTAVTVAACVYARKRGYRYAQLNAGVPEIYEKIGFKHIGDGHHWWMKGETFAAPPFSAREVLMVEAVCRGDLAAVDDLARQYTVDALNAPVTNGLTLMQLAVHSKQPGAAERLVQHGATYTALDAWDLGWSDRAAALLKNNPDEVNRGYEGMRKTLLHYAALRNDIALAQLALTANADLTIQDTMYHGIPLGWAQVFHREEIVRLIREASKK